MTFEQLYYFTEVYRQKSITKAADNLYVSRPALSTAIRKLEAEFGGVQFFTRMPNGVKATQAGDEFYQSAQIILEERARAITNMKKHTLLSNAGKMMKIGLSEGLLNGYGEEIAEKLISVYPHILFDFAQIVPHENPNFYEFFDLSIILTTESSHQKRCELLDGGYSITQVSTIPMYVWLSNSSPLQKYSVITMDMLTQLPFCSLKNTFNGINFSSYLQEYYHIENSKPNIELKNSFLQYIEQLGYYTIDHRSGKKGSLHYEEIFKDRAVSLKKTDWEFLLLIICKKEKYETYKNFYPLITDILIS